MPDTRVGAAGKHEDHAILYHSDQLGAAVADDKKI